MEDERLCRQSQIILGEAILPGKLPSPLNPPAESQTHE